MIKRLLGFVVRAGARGRLPATVLLSLCCCLLQTACQSGKVEGVSLLGRPLVRPTHDAEKLARLEQNLANAQARFDQDPADEDAIIWLGRRKAYLSCYREAIDIYSRGLEIHPGSYRLLRHRGHRYITTRQFDRAIADLTRAAELTEGVPDQVEQDGAPNALGIPISTTRGNIYYHLGLAHYLAGNFEKALRAYEKRTELDRNDDNRCSTAYWRHINLQRLGRADDAAAAIGGITEGMNVIENGVYYELVLLYKSVLSLVDLTDSDVANGLSDARINDATLMYGISIWHLFQSDAQRARSMWNEIVTADDAAWAAFGYIAAEADLARARSK